MAGGAASASSPAAPSSSSSSHRASSVKKIATHAHAHSHAHTLALGTPAHTSRPSAAAAAAAAAPDDKVPLLAEAGTLALALNIDWYQPFKQGHHSQGLIWMTIQNLPRAERFLEENMILIGVLPGPKETSRAQLQGALAPLRDELLDLFRGVQLKDGGPRVRAFLFMVVCDIPAARMTCGFAREGSAYGCPYCDGRHPKRSAGSAHNDWRLREQSLPANTHEVHKQNALAWARSAEKVMRVTKDLSKTIENVREMEFKKHGARWSVLLDLPYYDSIRCMPTDVMHSIMLGMCKHVMATMSGHRVAEKERQKKTSCSRASGGG